MIDAQDDPRVFPHAPSVWFWACGAGDFMAPLQQPDVGQEFATLAQMYLWARDQPVNVE